MQQRKSRHNEDSGDGQKRETREKRYSGGCRYCSCTVGSGRDGGIEVGDAPGFTGGTVGMGLVMEIVCVGGGVIFSQQVLGVSKF